MAAIHWHAARDRAVGTHAASRVERQPGHHHVRELRANGAGAAGSARSSPRSTTECCKDIGLTRADAEFLSNKPFWRE